MSDIEIRKSTWNDLDALNTHLPSTIKNFHEKNLKAQDLEEGIWLVAWKNEKPIGHVRIRWAGSENENVTSHVIAVPHIDSLSVTESFQNHGIGKLLIEALEDLARQRGFKQIGLSVGIENSNALEFYKHLGFSNWKHGTYKAYWDYVDSEGKQYNDSEERTYMLKQIS